MPLTAAVEVDFAGLDVLDEHALGKVVRRLGHLAVLVGGDRRHVAPVSPIVVATGTETRWKDPPEYWEISPFWTFRRNIPSGK